MLVLATGDVTPLVMAESSLQIINTAKRRMISWAVKPAQSVLGNREELTLPESITEVTREYIELDLQVFEASPTPPSPSAIHTAEEIINHHRLHELAREFMATDDTTLSAIEHAAETSESSGTTTWPIVRGLALLMTPLSSGLRSLSTVVWTGSSGSQVR